MKEQERKAVISRIEKNIEEKASLKVKYEQLKQLSNTEIVKQYLKLLDDIDYIEKKYQKLDTKEKIISDQFGTIFKYRNTIDLYPCKHDIWIYDGSYYLLKDPLHEHDNICVEYSEGKSVKKYFNYSFEYNRYICLECGKKLETKDWEKFEKSHLVLKNQNKETDLGKDYYINLYYQLLYSNDIESSQKEVIDEFNRIISGKVKVKK